MEKFPSTLHTPILLIGNYKILSKLGYGSFGEIYKGIDTITEQEVAIKIVIFSSHCLGTN